MNSDTGLRPDTQAKLEAAAIAAKATAYCPYSHFRVGCALLAFSPPRPSPSSNHNNNNNDHNDDNENDDIDGNTTIITGANIENASYPVGTCAERCAFGKGVTEGYLKYRAIAVATDITPAASPCGMCRQFIREFCALDMPVIMLDKDGKRVVKTLGELLPMSFGPEDLKKVE